MPPHPGLHSQYVSRARQGAEDLVQATIECRVKEEEQPSCCSLRSAKETLAHLADKLLSSPFCLRDGSCAWDAAVLGQ
eukprot:3664982-Rhodomonas_salina.1